uniref:Uncharacterized protein n=1 Tax=Anguilla anguilla TaxID=7936 RepID=A0A0E9QUH6_ANGAN
MVLKYLVDTPEVRVFGEFWLLGAVCSEEYTKEFGKVYVVLMMVMHC